MKKAQSQIISTFLLIMVVIVLVVIVIAFIVPFVREQLSGADCFKVADKIRISDNNQYTCYDTNKMRVQIHIGDIEQEIEGFVIELGGASSSSYDVIPSNPDNVKMFGDTPLPLEIPGKNTERTYIIDTPPVIVKPDLIRVYPKLKETKTCEASDTLNIIENCLS